MLVLYKNRYISVTNWIADFIYRPVYRYTDTDYEEICVFSLHWLHSLIVGFLYISKKLKFIPF